MTIAIDFQIVSVNKTIPPKRLMRQWLHLVLQHHYCQVADITIRIINRAEMTRLNRDYRHKNGATNVLSFTYQTDPLWGDIVLCAPLIAIEAKQQQKLVTAHWAHLTIHGILHLLGYDHVKHKDAAKMETLEIFLLQQLNFTNPYE